MMPRLPIRALAGALLCMASLLCAATEVNTANQAELEQVKGVGPQLSEQLLQERARGGAFAGWEDLVRRMKGVGPARAARLSAAGLRVAGQPYAVPLGAPSDGTSGAAAAVSPGAIAGTPASAAGPGAASRPPAR